MARRQRSERRCCCSQWLAFASGCWCINAMRNKTAVAPAPVETKANPDDLVFLKQMRP